jgi:threonine/homoserine/homoserine lactone efflux protein
MFEPQTLLVFTAAAALFAVFPGPAVMYIVTRSVAQGRRAGVMSALGIETGNLVHVAAAALGLSAVLASSALAFAALKYLGAAYLVYLGVRQLLHGRDAHANHVDNQARPGRLFANGTLIAVLNPKTALFFVAFLPQFIDTARGPAVVQIALLGVLLVAVTTVSDLVYAVLSGTAGGWLRASPRIGRARRYLSGGVYLSLGVWAALGGRPSLESSTS